ncbi:hypothetical protein [Chitinophaga sp. XS-30]|uniref:hypothetical protein n=1 Tax=Chitinophaga sp. XS-30 TaxID=2604421 RepID=UPI0011DCFAD5|nr:hypothetical protein [Chitinophaga sp. XS-30]QEH42061.1 hypothetical protein FW415_14740 [Chitinophaga sp. XS-30]
MMSLLSITDWFGQLPVFEKVYWSIAIFFTLLFLVQNAMSLFGGEHDGATGDVDEMLDADDGIGFQFFTIRNLFGFFTIFGWVGLAAIHAGQSNLVVVAISTIAGLAMMMLMAALFYYTGKLAYNGTLKMENAIASIATVYLPVPASRAGVGKVNLKVQGAFRELDAVTDDAEELRTGALVKVTQVLNNQLLLVTKQNL